MVSILCCYQSYSSHFAAIYVTFGGQTALNVGVKMKAEFKALGVKVSFGGYFGYAETVLGARNADRLNHCN